MLNKTVEDVFNAEPIRISPDTTISEAVEFMAERRGTSVIICEDDIPIGILTARDLPRLYEQHTDFSLSIREVMSTPVTNCQKNITLLDALDIMLEKGIRHIPVVNQKLELEGLISETNIMDRLGSTDLMRSQKVVEIMKTSVIQATCKTPFSSIMKIFIKEKIGSLVISEGNLPLGIITERDFPRLMMQQTKPETLAEEIMSKPPISISIHATAEDALLKMHQKHIHHLIITGSSGFVKGIVTRSCFFHDIGRYLIRKLVMTERKVKALSLLQEDYLSSIENFYLEATENAPHGIVIHKFGTIIYVNKSALQMFSFEKKHHLIGRLLESLFPVDVIRMGLDEPASQVANDGLFHLNKHDGTSFTAEISSTIIVFEGETATMLSLKDVTEQRELESRLRQAQKMEAVGTLAGGIAHDFNNMLAGITGTIFLAQKRVHDDVILKSKLNDIESLCFKAAGIVSQLLTFSRKDDIKMQRLSLVDFVKESLKLARVGVPENIDLRSSFSSEPLIVLGDASQFNQVMINLINNARDALDGVSSPYIDVTLTRTVPDKLFRKKHIDHELADAYACLSICDNGQGISSENRDKVFEPFFTTKEEGKGTGLGLAMVYGAIHSHGGIIDVDSTLGQGTSFHIYLPLLIEDAMSEEPVSDPSRVFEGNGETVLLIDDDEAALSATAEVLQSIGYQTLTAGNGEEGIRLFESYSHRIDLLLTDVVMPVMGGIEAAKQMKKLKPELPVLFTTGYAEAVAFVEHTEITQDQVITKPAHIALLSQRIKETLDQHKA